MLLIDKIQMRFPVKKLVGNIFGFNNDFKKLQQENQVQEIPMFVLW